MKLIKVYIEKSIANFSASFNEIQAGMHLNQ